MQTLLARTRNGGRTAALLLAVVLFFGVGVLVASCGRSSDQTTTTLSSVANTATTGGGVGVTIEDNAFSPATVTIGTGMDVMWTNRDETNHHTIVLDNGGFKSDDLAPPVADKHGKLLGGGWCHFTFDKPGTYTYHCGIHPSVTGTVIVK